MNGYVLTWMGVASLGTGVPALIGGMLLGKNLHHGDSYGSGFEAGKLTERYRQDYPGTASEQLAQLRQAAAGRVGGHGHDGPCSPDRGCY